MPYAFTEQGIYLLMTVLKGELAVRQSRTLIRLFKAMKDALINNHPLVVGQDYYAMVQTVEEHSHTIEAALRDIRDIKDKMVSKADLSAFMYLFDQAADSEEVLLLDGEPFKGDVVYQKIYRKAKKSIVIIDDYIGAKTLMHVAHARPSVKITIVSDNKARPPFTQLEYQDYLTENPGRNITFVQSIHQCHDRYIVLDHETSDVKVYHCGASSKDAGKRITTITRIKDERYYRSFVREMLSNPELLLR